MKHLPLRQVIVAAVFAILAAPAAHAFTFEGQANNSDGTVRYTDPAARLSGSGSGNGQNVIQQGNTTIQFGGQPGSFQQRYDPSRMFDPVGRPTNER